MENQKQLHGQFQGTMHDPLTKPNSNMSLAIFTTIACCLPLGILAIVKANNVGSLYQTKQYDAAIKAANDAKKWSYFGIFCSIIFWVVYLLFFCGFTALV